MIRWTTPVSRKRITYQTEDVGTTNFKEGWSCREDWWHYNQIIKPLQCNSPPRSIYYRLLSAYELLTTLPLAICCPTASSNTLYISVHHQQQSDVFTVTSTCTAITAPQLWHCLCWNCTVSRHFQIDCCVLGLRYSLDWTGWNFNIIICEGWEILLP